MYEIELKAHVTNKEQTISLLNNFATFYGRIIKNDTYYILQNSHSPKNSISCRIRNETHYSDDALLFTKNLLTYKSKENKVDSQGITYEVNVENETEISSPQALEKLLLDTGFVIDYTKHKDVLKWTSNTPYGDANIELCNVELLGDFLEIEILREENRDTDAVKEQIMNLFIKCNLTEKDIEPEYYSSLLKKIKKS